MAAADTPEQLAAPVKDAGEPPARPGSEAWSWLFMRLSGLALVFLALLHFAITHVVNDVVDTDYRFVVDRWSSTFWKVFDWLLLVLALGHGQNGARWIAEDYVRRPGARAVVKGLVQMVTGFLLIWGSFTIFAFNPGGGG